MSPVSGIVGVTRIGSSGTVLPIVLAALFAAAAAISFASFWRGSRSLSTVADTVSVGMVVSRPDRARPRALISSKSALMGSFRVTTGGADDTKPKCGGGGGGGGCDKDVLKNEVGGGGGGGGGKDMVGHVV